MTQILPKAFAIIFTHTLIGTPSVGKTRILLACYRSWAEKKRKNRNKNKKLEDGGTFGTGSLRFTNASVYMESKVVQRVERNLEAIGSPHRAVTTILV